MRKIFGRAYTGGVTDMGYRSDVTMAVAFATEEALKEVMATYAMLPEVQKSECMKEWKFRQCPSYASKSSPLKEWIYVAVAEFTNVKWYPSYEDVIAMEKLFSHTASFNTRDDFPHARLLIRIGEEVGDVDIEAQHRDGCEVSDHLADALGDLLHTRSEIINELDGEEIE